MSMEIVISHQQGRVPVTVFHVKGDINTETYEQLQAQAQQALKAGTRYLLLDLAEVPYVSSYGIRAISQLFTWLRGASGESEATVQQGLRDGTWKSPHLKLLNPSPQVLKVLTTAGVDMFLEIHTDLKQAFASF
jgi:anti-anti-sigma factor